MPSDRDRLRRLIEKLCIIEGDFVLSTGAKSRYYFDCKTVALDGTLFKTSDFPKLAPLAQNGSARAVA
jgi:orotate phosphoribosyltransferase